MPGSKIDLLQKSDVIIWTLLACFSVDEVAGQRVQDVHLPTGRILDENEDSAVGYLHVAVAGLLHLPHDPQVILTGDVDTNKDLFSPSVKNLRKN